MRRNCEESSFCSRAFKFLRNRWQRTRPCSSASFLPLESIDVFRKHKVNARPNCGSSSKLANY